MKSLTVALVLAALAGGCALLNPPIGDDGGDDGDGAGSTFAGEWVREFDYEEDGEKVTVKLVFDVTDDGSSVHGEMKEQVITWGGEATDPFYDSYTFDLTHESGGELKGKAKIVSLDIDGQAMEPLETSWKRVWVEGNQIKSEQEWRDGADTGVDTITYEFTPVAAPVVTAGGGGGLDPYTFVKAPPTVPVSDEMAIGWNATQSTEASGQKSERSFAVVGEEGDSWRIEYVGPEVTAMAASFPDLQGTVMGMVVNKDDGRVTAAVLGKPGEAGRTIEINPYTEPVEYEAPTPVSDSCTIGLGTFDALRTDTDYGKSWVGDGGELDGVLLKYEGQDAAANYELAEMPENGFTELDETCEWVHYVYSNGSESWTTEHPIVGAWFYKSFKSTAATYTAEVTALGTSCEPQLVWE
jgi:hypothetical protein